MPAMPKLPAFADYSILTTQRLTLGSTPGSDLVTIPPFSLDAPVLGNTSILMFTMWLQNAEGFHFHI
jgi:hypothetical protein